MIPAPLAAWAVTAAGKRVLFWVKVVALVAAVALVAWAGNRVTVWHDSHVRLEATEKALAKSAAELSQCTASATAAALAYAQAAQLAETTAAADRVTAERIERDTQNRLAAADARGRDLARRLHDDEARRCSGAVPTAAGPAAEPAATAGEPGNGDTVGDAIAAHLAACARDAERLSNWQWWWEGVTANRGEPH